MPCPLAKPARSQTGYLPFVLSLGMLLLALAAGVTAPSAQAQTSPAAATNANQQQPLAAPTTPASPAQPAQQPEAAPPAIAPTPGAAPAAPQQAAPTASPAAPAAASQAPVASDPAQQPPQAPAQPQTQPQAGPSNGQQQPAPGPGGEANPAAAGQAGPAPAPTQPATPAAAPAAAPVPAPAAEVAPPPSVEELLKPVNALSGAIDAAEKNLEQSPGTQKELATLRTGIEKLETKARTSADALKPRLEEVRSQIDKLGKAPGAEDPPEAPDVAAERQRLNGLAAQIDGAIKKAALIEERARQLISRVQNARAGIFTRFLFSQTDTPLQWRVWQQAGKQLHLAQRQLGYIFGNWWEAAKLSALPLLGIIAAAGALFAGLYFLATHTIRRRLDRGGSSNPSLPERAAMASWVTLAYALPPMAALALLYAGLDELGLLYWQVARIAQATVLPIVIVIGVLSLARALLQPNRPRWRLFNISDTSARTVNLAILGIVSVFALDHLASSLVRILSLPLSTSIVSAFIASLLYAVFLLVIVRTPLGPPSNAPGAPIARWQPIWLKVLLIALAVVLIGTAMLGFVSLGRYITTQLLTTGAGILLTGVLYIAIRWLAPAPSGDTRGMNEYIGQRLNLDDFGRGQLARIQRGVLIILLFGAALPLLMLSWGFTGAEITSWARAAVFGFEAGGLRISLARILAAVALFAGLLALTRIVQRWLAKEALSEGRIEAGLANSIYTGAGYIGFAVAALAAISYAGFDITSLAIVAGALSVGIGFGLQSIVNNFVSGLILLVERPIKVGDWVKLKEGQGYVRRIAVRATEIETFDRASLIVPNSQLISQTVDNLTHRNLLGRLSINVRVSYFADPDHVMRVLQHVAEKSTLILRHPPPFVVLENLGDNGMDFSLRVYLADINKSLSAQTELRAEIVKSLRAEGINIPFASALAGHATIDTPAGRTFIEIGVAHDSDPDEVLKALREAAVRGDEECNDIHIAFEDIGENALIFSLSVPVAEGVHAGAVRSELRTQAVKCLRERGISLASPQRSIRLRDLDDLRSAMARRNAENAMGFGTDKPDRD
ncbi:DUF3772 domain-containing protein [Hyphomicrobium sulfonivorans]|uniref:DUF3772 domain-containing protein n=1 Tax=Hyphomicrobium sulfonivorans TaxID=121290 RepID=UPI00156F6FEF|nr:DUF3772 domain-containing protein [Hyphomicrobium sulfonivorans]MBI1650398.1 mechanosensitive ion channel family protein [Hyphomicrobium sulfonivorans]NSL72241.1 hypothetical protein [Hyphomicrobium sulfonivorans]